MATAVSLFIYAVRKLRKPYYNVVKVVGGRAKRLAGSLAKMATDTNVPCTGASTLHCTENL